MMGEQISIIILMKDSGRMDWRQYRCSGLERNEAKVSRCVPRGERISNDPDLPDRFHSKLSSLLKVKPLGGDRWRSGIHVFPQSYISVFWGFNLFSSFFFIIIKEIP
ncbi:hypothetical protein ES708_08894 [subsurface metagenome]